MRPASLLLAAGTATLLSLAANSHAAVDYAKDIQPIFDAHCAKCHGKEKGLAKIRLHDPAAITESQGHHDDLLVAGNADESELYGRLILPADSKKLMPKGSAPLPKEDIEKIKQWIAEGAKFEVSADAPASEADHAMEEKEEPKAEPKPERPELAAASPEAIAEVENLGALVMPLYSGSVELRVSFPSSRDQVTDETVSGILPLAGQLVDLDLSGSKVTDASAEALSKFANLDTLHLERTDVGDGTVQAVAPLVYLQYLNLHSTKVTDEGIKSLEQAKSLEKLYLWKTGVSYDAAKALEKSKPGLEVNLGWDHPGVVRERLTTEMKQIEEQRAEHELAVTEAQKALEAAKADQQSAKEREAELKKQLEALDNPAPPAEVEAPAAEAPAGDEAEQDQT